MYNTLFGTNNLAILCLESVGIEFGKIPRFRDAIFKTKNKHHYVEILTRTGGQNRGRYDNSELMNNPNFKEEHDDTYDNTYRHFIFIVPERAEKALNWTKILNEQSRKNLNLKKMFGDEMREMNIPGTEAYERAQKIAKGFEDLFKQKNKGIQVISIDDLMKKGDKDGR